MVPQKTSLGVKFEPKWNLVNRGNTPATNIRFAAFADVLAFPLADDIAFPLPDDLAGRSGTIGPGLQKIISAMVPKLYEEDDVPQIELGRGKVVVGWGMVRYQDMFEIERYVRFALLHYRVGDVQWMSQDILNHNDAD
jgi:hypothetical protein